MTVQIAATRRNGHAVPELRQLVKVRDRYWVVADIVASGLPPDVVAERPAAPEHLLTLVSVEEDGFGEELRVIWELEPGTDVIQQAELPRPHADRFDQPARLDAFLDAVRWGAITNASASTLQAPFRSGVEIEDYQLAPVVRGLSMPRVNLLIADDVGLGKTVEAGLVVQELLLRHRARTVLVVCPASLCVHWRDQMAEKFGLEFRIVDAALLARLRRERGPFINPWTHFPRLIVSIDWLKRARPLKLLRETWQGKPRYPRAFDLLIVDEVHNVAPPGRPGGYATDSHRTRAIREIAPHFEHRLFLSATPHNGYVESFTALLALLDDQRFARGVRPTREQLAQVMIRRLKTEITDPDWPDRPRFAKRVVSSIAVDYPDDERAVLADLNAYAASRTRQQQALTGIPGRDASDFVLTLLKKRLLSSPAAFARTLAVHRETVTTGRRRATLRPTVAVLRQAIDAIEEDFGDEDAQDTATWSALDTAAGFTAPLTADQARLLDRMQAWAQQAEGRGDAKLAKLVRFLDGVVRTTGPDGRPAWTDERVIVFTEYRDTQRWLHEQLATRLGAGAGERIALLHGGLDTDQRERVKNEFLAAPDLAKVRILLATDAASEGIDLQRQCHRLVHYEIPWNPNRLEQRNGRVDRHGQPAPEVLVYHFAGSGGGDKPGTPDFEHAFLARVVGKVDEIRADLGSVGPVIADQVVQAMLGRRATLDTREAEGEARRGPARLLRLERDLREEVRELHRKLLISRDEQHLSPDNLRRVVETGLELAGQLPLKPAVLPRVAGDPELARSVFELPPLTGSWSRCHEGLPHPLTGQVRPITFHDQVAARHDDVVLVHLGHRLVQQSMRLLRAEIWSGAQAHGSLARVTARVVPDSVLDVPAVIVHGRLVVTGRAGYRLHEEVIAAGGRLPGMRFERLNVTEVGQLLAAVTDRMPGPKLRATLANGWREWARPLRAAFEARARDRAASLRRILEQRRADEAKAIAEVLGELKRSIEQELRVPEFTQLQLGFTEREREQVRRDTDALRHRIERIPDDIAAETLAIEARYADPAPRAFPAAVTFFVPRRMAVD